LIIPSCCTCRLNRRRALSIVSPSEIRIAANVGLQLSFENRLTRWTLYATPGHHRQVLGLIPAFSLKLYLDHFHVFLAPSRSLTLINERFQPPKRSRRASVRDLFTSIRYERGGSGAGFERRHSARATSRSGHCRMGST
jgi:hypothetical protein